MRKHTSPKKHRGGYGKEWRVLSKRYLAANPTCTKCGGVATEVDHIRSVKDHPNLKLAWHNLRSLCKPCHSRRTAQDQINKVVYGTDHTGYPIHTDHPWNKK